MGLQEDDQRTAIPRSRNTPATRAPSGSGAHAKPEGISWTRMLVWIGIGFLVAGIVAYRLVKPFFAHH